MLIHHLNCTTLCPPGRRLTDGRRSARGPAKLSCHCLLVETDAHGLVLVDTGLGLQDVHEPRPRLSRLFLGALSRPQLREESTALRQIEALGHRAEDVRHILLTHLDFDHAGGLDDFPHARVHLLRREHEAAFAQKTRRDRRRFRPRQWADSDRWALYESGGEPWFGFSCVRALDGLPPEILLVPLAGHTPGHAGIAVDRGDKWLLHAGDAYFFRGELSEHPTCPPGLRLYQRLLETDRPARLANQRRLRALARNFGREVEIFSAHDLVEFERLARSEVLAEPAYGARSIWARPPAERADPRR